MARALFAVNNIAEDKHNFAISYQIRYVPVNADGEFLAGEGSTTVVDDPVYVNLTDASGGYWRCR